MIKSSLPLLVLSFLLLAGNGWGATFYVDQTSGNDGNAGTSTGAAWKTISKVNGSSFSAGDSILFKRGESWRESLTVPSSGSAGNPITFSAYGTGTKPLFVGTIVIDSGTWTANDPVSGVWSHAIAPWRYVVWEDNVALRIASSANCTDGNFYFSGGTLYYKPTSGTLTDHTIETPVNYIGTGNNSHLTFDGIAFTKMLDGLTNAPTGETSGAGSNITIQNCTFTNGQEGISLNTDTAVPSNIKISNNTFDYNHRSISITHKYIGSYPDNIIINNNTIGHCSQVYGAGYEWALAVDGDNEGIGAQSARNSNIYNNIITGTCRGIYLYTLENEATHHVNVYNNHINTTRFGFATISEDNTLMYNINIYYNTILSTSADEGSTRYGAVILGSTTNHAGGNNTFYNNVVHGSKWNLQMWGHGAENNFYFDIKNNIFSSPVQYHVVEGSSEDEFVAANVTYGYNLYYPASANTFNRASTNYSFANWKAFDGRDAHSVTGDPKFANSGGGDFHLLEGSPAIDSGANVGLTTDYAGNPIPKGSGPDMGMYEFPGTGIINIPNSPSNLIIH